MNRKISSSTSLQVHLWIYNHHYNGISDQIEYFYTALTQNGYSVSIGRKPKDDALNVVIEYFTLQSKAILIDYCKRTKKRIAIIMTEHIDLIDNRIQMHGAPLWTQNDYMPPMMQASRIRFLMECLPYIRGFFVLGDLPELKGFTDMIRGSDIRTIPFPEINTVDISTDHMNPDRMQDFGFTGTATEYRKNIVSLLQYNNFCIDIPVKFLSRKQREIKTQSIKLVLNIPQRLNWKWLSLMRVMAGLRAGRATVSLGTKDTSKIAACTHQVDLSTPDWMDNLHEFSKNWSGMYYESMENYTAMAKSFESIHSFPHDFFEFWAITDQIEIKDSNVINE